MICYEILINEEDEGIEHTSREDGWVIKYYCVKRATQTTFNKARGSPFSNHIIVYQHSAKKWACMHGQDSVVDSKARITFDTDDFLYSLSWTNRQNYCLKITTLLLAVFLMCSVTLNVWQQGVYSLMAALHIWSWHRIVRVRWRKQYLNLF